MSDREPQPGLTLPDHIGVGSDEADNIRNKWDTFDMMELALTQMGFPPVEKPRVVRPIMTPDLLTNPDDKRYTEIYYGIKEWHNYTVNTLSRIRAALIQIPNEQRDLERTIRSQILASIKPGAKKPTVQEMKDVVQADPRYEELMIEKQKLEQQQFLLHSHVEGLSEDLKLCSRNVEIRRQERDYGASTGAQPRFRQPAGPPGRMY